MLPPCHLLTALRRGGLAAAWLCWAGWAVAASAPPPQQPAPLEAPLQTEQAPPDEIAYRAEVVARLPHSRQDFTQGLEIHDGKLYQSTGLYGASRLQVFELATGKRLLQRHLPPRLFGEGLTVLGGRIIQLTWRAGIGRVYRLEDLELIAEFPLPGEGWGLANNGEQLIYSDGSHRLRFLSPEDWSVQHSLEVTRGGQPLRGLNELEWTPDAILANVWGADWIAMIDERTGAVRARIDLSGLLPAAERAPRTDVLNGIARDPATGALWVTGKNWPWLYQIELRKP